jgi:hypothetical protein
MQIAEDDHFGNILISEVHYVSKPCDPVAGSLFGKGLVHFITPAVWVAGTSAIVGTSIASCVAWYLCLWQLHAVHQER